MRGKGQREKINEGFKGSPLFSRRPWAVLIKKEITATTSTSKKR
jgi:hypothetical protein